MTYQRYLAELLGAFALTFIVTLSLGYTLPISTPVLAALTLGLFVYTVGGISGAHLNPAVTIGMCTARKITVKNAAIYVVCQFIGAGLAMGLARYLTGAPATISTDGDLLVATGEAIGAAVLAFGVMSATLQKVPAAASGLTVGGSLLLGIMMASPFSNGVLNPAVAFGIGAWSPMYMIGPVVGAIAGAFARLVLDSPHAVGSDE